MLARFEKITPAPGRSFRVSERKLARFDAPWHFHPEIELTLIVESRGRRFVGDSIETFGPGDLVLVGSNLPHFWHNEGEFERAHSVVVQFRPDFLGEPAWETPELRRVGNLLHRAGRGLAFHGPAAAAVSARLRELPGIGGAPALLELIALLDKLAGARARELAGAAYVPSLDHGAEARLARVFDFLMANYREPLTLREVAKIGAMTPAAFSRYFKRATGRNPFRFINELRIDHAARRLADGERTVAEIAADAGFTTLSSFNRRFRERLGCAPREYRRALRGRVGGKAPPAFVDADGPAT